LSTLLELEYIRFIIISIARLVVVGTTLIVVILGVLIVLVVCVLSLSLALGVGLTRMAVPVVILALGGLWMGGHLGQQLKCYVEALRCVNMGSFGGL
jgi:hypothetical protein